MTRAATSLWGDYLKADAWEKLDLSDAAKRMEDRLDKEIAQQEKLIDSQVELNRAKQEALRKEQPMYKIYADNLQPSLQRVLLELVELVQIQSAEQGQAWLLPEGS